MNSSKILRFPVPLQDHCGLYDRNVRLTWLCELQSKSIILSFNYKTKLVSPKTHGQGHQESFAVQCESVDDVQEPRLSRFLLRETKQGNRNKYNTFQDMKNLLRRQSSFTQKMSYEERLIGLNQVGRHGYEDQDIQGMKGTNVGKEREDVYTLKKKKN